MRMNIGMAVSVYSATVLKGVVPRMRSTTCQLPVCR